MEMPKSIETKKHLCIFLDQVAYDGDKDQLSQCGTTAPGLYYVTRQGMMACNDNMHNPVKQKM